MSRHPTEEVLGWIAKERDYQRLIGYGNAKSLEDELLLARYLLNMAIQTLPVSEKGKNRTIIANMRRIAANFVRALEKHGFPDQEMQKVREVTVTLHREGEGE